MVGTYVYIADTSRRHINSDPRGFAADRNRYTEELISEAAELEALHEGAHTSGKLGCGWTH